MKQHRISENHAIKNSMASHCHFCREDYPKLQQRLTVSSFQSACSDMSDQALQRIFRPCKPPAQTGCFVLHTIGRSNGPSATNPFIRKYIFPGGYMSTLSEVLPAIEKAD